MHYSLSRAAAWNIAGYTYLIIASLISTPILVHSLGLSLFGLYSLIIATLSLISAFDLGLPQAVVQALSKHHDSFSRRQTIWATSSILFVSTGVISGLIVSVIAYYLHVPYVSIPLIFGLALMNNLISHYSSLPHAEGHFGYFNAKTFIVGTANTLIAAYLAWKGEGITVILTSQLLCYIITLLPLAYFSLKYFPKPWLGRPSIAEAKLLVSFGLKNQVGKAVGQVQAQYAKFLLAGLSPISLSSYVVASGLVQKFAGGIGQLSSALYPASARGGHSNIRSLYYNLQLSLFCLGILIVLVFRIWGLGFLQWWLQSPDLVSLVHSVMRVLVWYLAILMLTPLSSAILDGRGKPEITSFFAFLTTIIEIGIALVLFPRFGILAPAYAALVAVALTTPALLISTARVLKSSL